MAKSSGYATARDTHDGPKGDTGSTGLTGATGENGASGTASRLDIAYFTNLDGSGSNSFPTGTLAGGNYVKATKGSKNFQGTDVVTWNSSGSETAVSNTVSDYEITQITGDTGTTGNTGNTGSQGDTGAKGDTGDTGNTGSTGLSNRLDIIYSDNSDGTGNTQRPTGTIGGGDYVAATSVSTNKYIGTNVVTWTTSEPAVSTTNSDYEFTEFVGDKGDTGDTGGQGVQGDTGEKGDTGDTGNTGNTGTAGINSAVVSIYIRKAGTAPTTKPNGNVTYTFATGVLTTVNLNGWSATIPAGTDTLYLRIAPAISNTATNVIAISDWSDAVQSQGKDGINTATLYYYQWSTSSTAPALPNEIVTYTFTTSSVGSGQVNNRGWTFGSIPTKGSNTKLYQTIALTASITDTSTVATSEWSTAREVAVDGDKGDTGNTGNTGGQGDTGDKGDTGNTGTAGAVWHTATGAPSASLGVVGDFYLRIDTEAVYDKTGATTWTLRITTLKGDTGSAGTNADVSNFIFQRAATIPGSPANSAGVPSGWLDNPPTPSAISFNLTYDFLDQDNAPISAGQWAARDDNGHITLDFTNDVITLQLNKTDAGGTDRTAALESIANGTVITFTSENEGGFAGGSAACTVTAVHDNNNYVAFTVTTVVTGTLNFLNLSDDAFFSIVGTSILSGNLYTVQGVQTEGTGNFNWGTVIQFSGDAGSSGTNADILSTVYQRASILPSSPADSAGSVPTGWFVGPPAGSGGDGSSLNLTYSSQDQSGAPTSSGQWAARVSGGYITFNFTSSVIALELNKTDGGGTDRTAFLESLVAGTVITFTSENGNGFAGGSAECVVTSVDTSNSSYVIFNVTTTVTGNLNFLDSSEDGYFAIVGIASAPGTLYTVQGIQTEGAGNFVWGTVTQAAGDASEVSQGVIQGPTTSGTTSISSPTITIPPNANMTFSANVHINASSTTTQVNSITVSDSVTGTVSATLGLDKSSGIASQSFFITGTCTGGETGGNLVISFNYNVSSSSNDVMQYIYTINRR